MVYKIELIRDEYGWTKKKVIDVVCAGSLETALRLYDQLCGQLKYAVELREPLDNETLKARYGEYLDDIPLGDVYECYGSMYTIFGYGLDRKYIYWTIKEEKD